MATDLEKVRFLGGRTAMTLFEDDELQIAIDCTSSLREAAAMALRSLAADRALLAAKIESLNYKGDTTKVSEQLAARADELIKEENSIPASATAEMGHGPIGRHQILDNQWARQGIGNSQ